MVEWCVLFIKLMNDKHALFNISIFNSRSLLCPYFGRWKPPSNTFHINFTIIIADSNEKFQYWIYFDILISYAISNVGTSADIYYYILPFPIYSVSKYSYMLVLSIFDLDISFFVKSINLPPFYFKYKFKHADIILGYFDTYLLT